MADDQTNPYTMMGMLGMMSPNKYLNPMYKDKPLPMPGYYGDPTDASGQKIQSYQDTKAQHDAWDAANPQGTTLTSTPQQGTSDFDKTMQFMGMGDFSKSAQSRGMNPRDISTLLLGGPMPDSMTQPTQQAAAPAASSNPFNMRQAYLTALSDPQGGKPMPVPGATVAPSQPLGTPSVMDAFLQAHPEGGATTGGYSNKPFFSTLNQLRSA